MAVVINVGEHQFALTCSRCGSLVLVEEEDVYVAPLDVTDGGEHAYFFKCPNAGRFGNVFFPSRIDPDKIPDRLKGKLVRFAGLESQNTPSS